MSPLLVVQCKVGSLKPYAYKWTQQTILYMCVCVFACMCVHVSLCYICNKYKQRKSDYHREWKGTCQGLEEWKGRKSDVNLFQLQIKYNWKQLSGAACQLCIELRVSWWSELVVSKDVQCFVFRFGGPWRGLWKPKEISDKQCPFLGLGSKLSYFLKLNPEITCSVSVLPNMS